MADPIDYSGTHRILLLIDLHPILLTTTTTSLNQNPTSYIAAVKSTASAISAFPPLQSSLFSFKFFYSSLSPLLYPTKPPLSLQFDRPSETLAALTESLTSVQRSLDLDRVEIRVQKNRSLLLDGALRQILHDYGWEGEVWDSDPDSAGMKSGLIRSNLVVLLSPVRDLNLFMDMEKDKEGADCVDKFSDVFGHVRDLYVKSDIHLSWIDVKTEMESRVNLEPVKDDVSGLGCEDFGRGVRSLGWGFCSTDSVVLGTALVGFGMLYPLIALAPDFYRCEALRKKYRGQLLLEVLDVSGKPLECKGCDLELLEVNSLLKNRLGCGLRDWERASLGGGSEGSGKTFLDMSCNGNVKLHVKGVGKYAECGQMKGCLRDIFMLREAVGRKGCDKVSGDFYADKVLRMLRFEMSGSKEMVASGPMWQIFLSYLYKESFWAFVSFIDGSGSSCTGILKPYTIDSALLFVMNNEPWAQTQVEKVEILDTSKKSAEMKPLTIGGDTNHDSADVKQMVTPVSQEDGKTIARRKSHVPKNLNWSGFCKMAYERSRIDLGDAYFSYLCDKSRKLKFLKCWMKQVKKSSCNLYVLYQSEQNCTPTERDDTLVRSSEDGEQPLSTPISVGENSLSDSYRTQDAVTNDIISETPEVFISNLPIQIQEALDSKGLDLGAFAERIVNLTLQGLRVKYENGRFSQSESTAMPQDDLVTSKMAGELTRFLLMDPKDIKAKHRNTKIMLDSSSSSVNSDSMIRRFELQILFRMEILRSKIEPNIAESLKQKFVKQICMLLESIQCHLEVGFFGDWSLDSYLAKFLRSRYSHDLEGTLHQIYSRMDLLLFTEDDKDLNVMIDSEDSSQNFRDKVRGEELGENEPTLEPVNTQELVQAHERRERARRFSSFTSWIPDLQRVWAPKHQPQLTCSQSELNRKHSKRSSWRRASLDKVCETPESNKKSCLRRSLDSSCKSASKALFQDDQDCFSQEI